MAAHRRQQRSSSPARLADSTPSHRAAFTLTELGIHAGTSRKSSPKKMSSSGAVAPSLFETVVGYPLRAVWLDLTKTAIIFILVCSLIGAVSLSPLL